MEWLNIRLTQFASPEYVRSAPIERATWIQLLQYCCGQENGGIITDCADWKDRTWQQICGVTLREVKSTSRLWYWDGNNLHVWGYPLEKERLVQLNRDTGRQGGLTKSLNRAKAKIEPSVLATLEPTLQGLPVEEQLATLEQTLLRKGKEGKGKEGKATTTTTGASATSSDQAPAQIIILNRGCTLDEATAFADRFTTSSPAGFAIPRHVVTLWHDDRTASGWVKVRDGHELPIADWQADLRAYAQRYAANERSQSPRQGPPRLPGRPSQPAAPHLSTEAKGGF